MKRTRKKVLLDVETLQGILDECYHETNELKYELSNLYVTWNAKVGDLNEIAVVGKDIVKLLDQRDKIIDKKLKLAQQINYTLANNKKEETKIKIAEMRLSDDNGSIKIPDAELPEDLDYKINEMIEAARKRRN